MFQQSNTTSSEAGPFLSAEASNVRPEDLGSVFQRYSSVSNDGVRTYDNRFAPQQINAKIGRKEHGQKQQQQQQQQHYSTQYDEPKGERGERRDEDNRMVRDKRDSRVRHHFYKQYHHEESTMAAAPNARNYDDEYDGMRQEYENNEKATHRFENITSPRSRARAQERNVADTGKLQPRDVPEESPTKRRLRAMLNGRSRAIGAMGTTVEQERDDDERYYDDVDENGEEEQNTTEKARKNSAKRMLLIIIVVCVIASIGVFVLLAKCGDGNPWRGLCRLIGIEQQQKQQKETTTTATIAVTAATAATRVKERENEKKSTQTAANEESTNFLSATNLDFGDSVKDFQEYVRQDQCDDAYNSRHHAFTDDEQGREQEGFPVDDAVYNNASCGTPVLLPPNEHNGTNEYSGTVVNVAARNNAMQPVQDNLIAAFPATPAQPLRAPTNVRGPAALVPGAENRSRPDMMREISPDALGENVRNIYGATRTTLLGTEGRSLYESAGGAAAERFLGMSEPPAYDPATDASLDVAGNASKTMIALYNEHQKKASGVGEGAAGVPIEQHDPNRRAQKRADTQPLQQIQSSDESFGVAHQKRKEIAAKSQSAVSDIYKKKQLAHSATSASSAAFVHDPAKSGGIEYMNVHTQTYLGEQQ